MPKLDCLCGYAHDLSPIPDGGHRTIRDCDYDTHEDDLRAALGGDGNAMNRVRGLWGQLYECPGCGRLAWTRDGFKTIQFFLPEPVREGVP